MTRNSRFANAAIYYRLVDRCVAELLELLRRQVGLEPDAE